MSQQLDGDRDGTTYERPRDLVRLNKQAQTIFNLLADGQWRTLNRISVLTGYPEASISARLRDFRKEKFGAYTIEREHIERGLHRYRLVLPMPYQTEMHFLAEQKSLS